MLPDGWTYANLGEIASTVTSGSRDWAQYYSDAGDKFVRMTNLSRDGVRISENDMKYVAIPPDSSDGKRTSLKNGDILISITAELGKIGLVPKGFGTAFINQHLALVRLKNGTASSPFVAYALSSKKLNQKLNSLNDAGAKAGLNLSTIRSFPLALPPLPEQKKIAAILSTWDRAIEGTEKLLANSQQQKKALMQQLLTGKKRLPGFRGAWETKRLKSISKIYDGTHQTPDYVETGIPFYSVEHLTSGEFNNTKFISDEVYQNESRKRKIEKNDTLLTRIGDIGTAKLIDWDVRASFYVSLALIKANKIMSPKFFECALNSESFKRELWHRTIHVAFPKKINLGDIGDCSIRFPHLPEQEAIAAVLSTADEEITAIESDLLRLRQEKKALMQQLLTGKRRVKVD
ncbi:restriction endonuclease subunit S [Novacetimonas pomaceti]|uniref:restriction endonuclease subunit S n=1 Tax=Novacetimonas pomaceti TaxID=2021998 RepID=UPI001C2D83F6|nr:restriction endonuclease subunit S [Novacetimonas pomaceti]MBV1834352.1 restriction endonuclease subunit S [Novacetimonas pomaceti]